MKLSPYSTMSIYESAIITAYKDMATLIESGMEDETTLRKVKIIQMRIHNLQKNRKVYENVT